MKERMLKPDESLRERNFRDFERRYGRRPVVSAGESGQFRMAEAASGAPVIEVCISEDGVTAWIPMNSLYDPEYEAGRWAENYRPENRRVTFAMQGFAAGYQLRALLSSLRQDTQFFIFEPEEALFSFVCAFLDLSEIIGDPRVHIFLNPDLYTFQNALKQDIIPWNTITFGTRLPFYQENAVFNEAFRAACALQVTNANYQRVRGRMTLTNRLYAWMHLHRNYTVDALLTAIPRNVPVIIATGGPSLNKNVDELRSAGGHALIICVDRALKTLLNHSILPDIIATIDVDKDPSYLIPDDAEEISKIPMLCSFRANAASQELFDGRLIYFGALNEENALPGIDGRLPVQGVLGGNVAAACYTTFAEAGQKTVILVGQDLANLGDVTHADGSDDGALVDDDFIEVEGIDGRPVKSHEDWIHFRDYYEEMILRYPGTHVIDATEGGALIHGSEVMTLREAIERECTGKFDAAAALMKFPAAQTKDGHEATIRLLMDRCKELDDIEELSAILRDKCGTLLEDRGVTGQQAVDDIISLRDRIREKPVFPMLADNWILDRDILPDRNILYRDEEELRYLLERERAFAEVLKDDSWSLKDAIERILLADNKTEGMT